jgi:PIN domain nuclease of toxin-antitoxin system
LWWFAASPQLSHTGRDLIANEATTVIVSAVSAWEVCTKVRIGKLADAHELCEDFSGFLARHEFEPLPISVEHARLAGRLGGDHKDPFDRLLAAQSLIEQVPLVTNDAAFAQFGVKTMW